MSSISALYMTFFVIHLLSDMGQGRLRHLQVSVSGSVVFSPLFNSFLLCAVIIWCMFGVVEYEIFTLFLFITGCKGWFLGKCLLINFRNSWPNLVVKFLLKGGVYQRMFLFFFLFLLIGLVVSGGGWDAGRGCELGRVAGVVLLLFVVLFGLLFDGSLLFTLLLFNRR